MAEDLIADKLEIGGPRSVAYDDPTAGEPGIVRGRLPGFNLYNDIQVTRWDGLLANYSINYALGAYLARNYGGAALFSAIVQSEHAGTDAIEAALQDLGYEDSFGQTLQNWGVAVLRSNDTSAPVPYRYNAGDWITSYAGGIRVPARLDQPAPLRVRASPGARLGWPWRAHTCTHGEQPERAHAAAALGFLHHSGAQYRNHAAERQRRGRQPHHGGGQGVMS